MSSASRTNQPLNCTAACKKLNRGNLKVIKEQQEKIDVLSTRNQELEFLFELKNSENEQLKRDRDQTEDRRCWLIIDNEELKGKLDKATKGRASGKKKWSDEETAILKGLKGSGLDAQQCASYFQQTYAEFNQTNHSVVSKFHKI